MTKIEDKLRNDEYIYFQETIAQLLVIGMNFREF